MKKITIIIPAHNEEKRISRTLKEYLEYFENLEKNKILEYHILVVINASTDKTLEIVKKIKENGGNITYLNLERSGKGYAIIEGFKNSLKRRSEILGFVDADMATSPNSFYELVKNIEDYDGIIASRYLKNSVVYPKQAFLRILVSRIFNFFIRAILILPYRDTQCGAKIFSRESISDVLPSLSLSKWAFDVDLIYHLKKKKYSIKEIPTRWSDREYSKINFMRAGPMMVLGVIRLRILNSPLKSFIKIYDKLAGRRNM